MTRCSTSPRFFGFALFVFVIVTLHVVTVGDERVKREFCVLSSIGNPACAARRGAPRSVAVQEQSVRAARISIAIISENRRERKFATGIYGWTGSGRGGGDARRRKFYAAGYGADERAYGYRFECRVDVGPRRDAAAPKAGLHRAGNREGGWRHALQNRISVRTARSAFQHAGGQHPRVPVRSRPPSGREAPRDSRNTIRTDRNRTSANRKSQVWPATKIYFMGWNYFRKAT